jgi:phosphoglycolate phosphatase
MAAPPLSILFDLDGTVVDSKPGILASCSAALRALGHRPDSLDIGNLIGPPLEEVLTEVLGRFGDDRVAEAVLAYRDHYGTAGFLETTVYPGLVAVLDQLVALKAKLYVATSKRSVFAEQILEHLGLIDLFAGVHGSEPGGAIDRKADLIADVLRRHELSADRCLMVGDRRQDAEGARANGVSTVGVLWGYGDRDELESAGVMHIAAYPGELIQIAEAHRRKVGPPSAA